jgi:hemoglobin
MEAPPRPSLTPYQLMGNSEALIRAIVATFYRHMALTEPELAKTHQLNTQGFITERTQLRFAQFLIEWLGGPQLFTPDNGHPRLRMRHARVPINTAMRDAWLRCMSYALDQHGVSGEVRAFLNTRLSDLADFLRNQPD